MDFIEESSWNFPKLKWLDSYLAKHSGFIAGGCFKHLFAGEKTKDIDMFFRSEADFIQARDVFKGNEEYAAYYDNAKVEAFKNVKSGIVVELIKTTYGTPEQVIGAFDFTITKFTYFKHITEDDDVTFRCLYHPKYFEHFTLKRLVTDDEIPFPVSTFERMFRYAKYGYFPCRETKRRVVEAIHDLPTLADISLSLYDGLD